MEKYTIEEANDGVIVTTTREEIVRGGHSYITITTKVGGAVVWSREIEC